MDATSSFLGSEFPNSAPEDAFFHVIPVPYEHTVSYGGGTAGGPQAIIEASSQMEVWDGFSVPGELGIHTQSALNCDDDADSVFAELAERVAASIAMGACPVVLGGEHSVTNGPIRALAKLPYKVGIVQFDAHGDLRHAYEGDIYSHASVMRRAVDAGLPLFEIGLRSLSPEDLEARERYSIAHLDAHELQNGFVPENVLPADFPEHIFVTFDIDGLDASIMPATGTPEPGGLLWYQSLNLFEKVIRGRKVVGFDVVELAPIKGFPAYDFTTARLIYNFMGLIQRNP